jgi:Fe-S-cluster containining protein
MCCDGSLFGRVPLAPEEVDRARKRLRVIASKTSFEQPCSAHDETRACAIYDERPLACRKFTCRLYERHRAEGGPLEARLAVVARARALIARANELGRSIPELEDLLEAEFSRPHQT